MAVARTVLMRGVVSHDERPERPVRPDRVDRRPEVMGFIVDVLLVVTTLSLLGAVRC